MTPGLKKAANIVITQCLNVRKGERALVVTDKFCREIGDALWQALKNITDPILLEIVPREIHGQEPPDMIADILEKCDVFILPTYRSLTHTRARINACQHGARGATMPGITVEIMKRTLNADYKRIARLTKKLAFLLTRAKKARIMTSHNAQLTLNLEKRTGYIDNGQIKKPGEFSNLPGGEAYIAPLEKYSNGEIVIDGSFAPIGHLENKVYLEIRHGQITRLSGSQKMKKIFDRYAKPEKTLCEFGIGTNYEAKITGNVLEDEKALGSIHVAFGNNLGFGGKNKANIHLDGVVKKPSVWLDDKLIINKGKYLI